MPPCLLPRRSRRAVFFAVFAPREAGAVPILVRVTDATGVVLFHHEGELPDEDTAFDFAWVNTPFRVSLEPEGSSAWAVLWSGEERLARVSLDNLPPVGLGGRGIDSGGGAYRLHFGYTGSGVSAAEAWGGSLGGP